MGRQKQSFAYKTLYASYEQGSQVIINNNQPVNAQNAQDLINRHRQIVQLINNLAGQSTSKYTVCDVYMKIYQSYQKFTRLKIKEIAYYIFLSCKKHEPSCKTAIKGP